MRSSPVVSARGLPEPLALAPLLFKHQRPHERRDERGHQEQASKGRKEGLFARIHFAPLNRGQFLFQIPLGIRCAVGVRDRGAGPEKSQ